jgi:hypothetical protein
VGGGRQQAASPGGVARDDRVGGKLGVKPAERGALVGDVAGQVGGRGAGPPRLPLELGQHRLGRRAILAQAGQAVSRPDHQGQRLANPVSGGGGLARRRQRRHRAIQLADGQRGRLAHRLIAERLAQEADQVALQRADGGLGALGLRPGHLDLDLGERLAGGPGAQPVADEAGRQNEQQHRRDHHHRGRCQRRRAVPVAGLAGRRGAAGAALGAWFHVGPGHRARAVPDLLARPDPVAPGADHLVVAPGEQAVLPGLGVVDQRDLERQVEEARVDELIAVRQEHAEPGMGVIPADHALARPRIHLLVDVLPGGVREGQLGSLLLGVQRVDGRLDAQVRPGVVAQELADQHAAHLARRVAGTALDGAVERLLGQEDAVLLARRGAGHCAKAGLVDGADVE